MEGHSREVRNQHIPVNTLLAAAMNKSLDLDEGPAG